MTTLSAPRLPSSDPIPSGWERLRLDAVADVRLGRQRSPHNHAGPRMRPYLRAANVTWSGVALDDVKEMNFTEAESAVYELRNDDLILSEASGSPGEVGKPAIWRGQIAGCCFQNTLLRVRPGERVDAWYLLWLFGLYARDGTFARRSRGVGIHHLGAQGLSSLPILVPPLEEQRRIVEAIEEQTGRLDAAASGVGSVRVGAVRLQEAITRTALAGRVIQRTGDSTGADHLRAELGIERGTDAIVHRSELLRGELMPGIPSHWTWTTLGKIASITGGVTKDARKEAEPGLIEVPYLRVANVQRGYLNLHDVARIRVTTEKATALYLQEGDVLFNEGGDRDKLGRGWVWEGAVANCIHQNHVFRARIAGEAIHPKLLSWFSNSFGQPWFEASGKQTTNLASIGMRMLQQLPVPIPPRAEQLAMVGYLERQLSVIDAVRRGCVSGSQRIAALRHAILRSAFAGGLTRTVTLRMPADTAGASDQDRPAAPVSDRQVAGAHYP